MDPGLQRQHEAQGRSGRGDGGGGGGGGSPTRGAPRQLDLNPELPALQPAHRAPRLGLRLHGSPGHPPLPSAKFLMKNSNPIGLPR